MALRDQPLSREPMEADVYDDDDPEASLADGDSIYTESLRSSLRQSVVENGRLYHKYREGKYILPNDETENSRLDLQNQMFDMTLDNRLLLAPVGDDVREVLDVGCGTGLWAIAYADEHPLAQVTGVDLSPIQPAFTPKNCKFEIDDIEEPWTYVQKFDLIHSRMMTGSLADWPKFFSQAFNALNPGGWLEMQDLDFPIRCDDDSMPPSSALYRWNQKMVEAGVRSGRETNVPGRYQEWMVAAGFVDVVRVNFKWPQNPWPRDPRMKEMGKWNLVNTLDGLYAFSVALFTRFLGMTVTEVEEFLVDVRRDIQDRRVHAYWLMCIVYGRKPTTKL